MTTGSAHPLIAAYVRSVQRGQVRGQLQSLPPYVALVLDASEGIVKGEWLELEDEALEIADEWEQNEYERVWIVDEREAIEGWVYIGRGMDGRGDE
jgi:gamma-glutamylcyclotransferase (GGCT)/AIG2-like uncharacterized protein YtfP